MKHAAPFTGVRVAFAGLTLVVLFPTLLVAQNEPPAPVTPPASPPPTLPTAPQAAPAAEPAKPARATPTLETLLIGADEIPKDWVLDQELACGSPIATKLWEGSALDATAGTPKRKEFQTLSGPSGRGSLLYFEFEGRIPKGWSDALPSLLWSERGTPTRTQPELLVRSGNLLVVISCSLSSPMRRFACDRLRKRFGFRLPDSSEDRARVLAPLMRAASAGDATGGLQILAARQKELAGLSLTAFYEAKLREANKEWLLASQAYAHALEIDAASDPLPDDLIAHDCIAGRGMCSYEQKQYDEAITLLQEAARTAAALGEKSRQAVSIYNCACCFALSGKGDEAMAALKESLALDPETLKPQAKKDTDLDSIRTRPEFAELVNK